MKNSEGCVFVTRTTKRRFKRANAVILTICLFVSIIGGINIKPASAMTTQSAAVNWIRSQNGKAIDMDGRYGAQCVDLIAAYFEYLGVSWRSMTVTYAKDYAWRSLPDGWQRIQGGAIQPGDIVIWTGGTTGHVALAISGDRIVEQNYNYINASNAIVKIKIGKRGYKKAAVKGKRFELKLKYKLTKRTKIIIKVNKKNYKSLIKSFIVK